VVKIRLKKLGTKKRPYYRIVVQDSRNPVTAQQLKKSASIIQLKVKINKFLLMKNVHATG